jgi:4-hydroxythreonine-4-phosphate dehydrogenase
MKVYVTQGHQGGIGLEVFLKSSLMLSREERKLLRLLAFRKSVAKTLESLKIPFELRADEIILGGVSIETTWLDRIPFSESLTALELGMKLSETGGVLYTLPTSKDQFPGFAGHTEYFRHCYNNSSLGMFFSSPDLRVLLLSDHVAIRKLPETLTESLIYEKLKTSLVALRRWSWPTKRVLISGFNPHAGENGLIGDEDERIRLAMNRLKKDFSLDMLGPLSGDTMLFEKKSPNDVLVYLFHDQGLGVFKGQEGFIGSNITLGLPYPRLSPDHGTPFGLFGKNRADYRGCLYSLREAINLLKRVSHGQNSSH